MGVIEKVMFWIANTMQFIYCVVWNYPKMWICTYIIRKRIQACPEVLISAAKASMTIQEAVKDGMQCRIELTDMTYVLPKKEWITYINDNLWRPYKKIKQMIYGVNFDCDNFASSFFTMVQELSLGLCIGIAHYGFVQDGKYLAHAVSCFIPVDDQKFWLIEPQADGCQMWPLNKDIGELFFVYLEGREKL